MKKLLFSVVLFIIGVTFAFAGEEERSVTYNVSSKGELTITGTEPAGSVAEFTNSYIGSTKTYIPDEATATLTLKNYDGYIVKGLTLRMRANQPINGQQTAGKGTFYFNCGEDEIAAITKATNIWYGVTFTNIDANVCVEFNPMYANGYVVDNNQDLIIKISATEKALYIKSYTIIYEKITNMVAAPQITPTKGDTFYRKQQIYISCEDDVDAIYFTTDGTEPTTSSQKYDENVPLYIDEEITIKAFAVKGNEQSNVTTKTFTKEYPKSITAFYEDQYYGMTNKPSANKHLYGGKVSVYNNKVICTPEDFMIYAFVLNYEQGIIKNGEMYLCYDENKTNLTIKSEKNDKLDWLFTNDGKICQKNYTNRKISYSKGNNYFGTFSDATSTYIDAYPMDLVKGYVRDSLSPNKLGTICLPYDVLNDDRSGATFYNILGKEIGGGTTLILEEETGTLVAGRPYIFEVAGDADALCCMYLDIAESKNAAAESCYNGLNGSLTEIDVEQGMYLISDNKIVKCGTGCKIAANRAYIDMEKVPVISSVKQTIGRTLSISADGEATGIDADAFERQDNAIIYDLQGQRVITPSKGLYIVNGKKTILK